MLINLTTSGFQKYPVSGYRRQQKEKRKRREGIGENDPMGILSERHGITSSNKKFDVSLARCLL